MQEIANTAPTRPGVVTACSSNMICVLHGIMHVLISEDGPLIIIVQDDMTPDGYYQRVR